MNETTLEKMLAALTPDLVQSFKRAIEIGKWPDGRRLTDEQRATCMQAVIAWEHHHLPEDQRVGYIDKGEKDGDTCSEPHDHHEQPISFRH
ncbi:MAG: YeaC family protein [Moraxellaceae bacterium]|nr:YeaC family protein [Moraxellaceae bacterium]